MRVTPDNPIRSVSRFGSGNGPRRARRPRRAFTLVEAIVAMVVVVILAGAVMVRIGDLSPRRFDLAAVRVQNLLEALAHRQAVSQARLALVYDADERELWVERLAPPRGERGDELAATDEEATWERDLLTPPARFEDEGISIAGARFNGEFHRGDFRLELPPEEPRPVIEIDVAFREDEVETIELLPHAIRARRWSALDSAGLLAPEDLDEEGAGDERW